MLMRELIVKKRDGNALSTEEIAFMIHGYVDGSIPDYQMSAMLMAIYYRGMSARETLDLTMAMLHSGSSLDLSVIDGVKADKHSTGGVGDKTSLVLCPMVAAQGVKIAKMSGRGLGHTGGTIDKLESIPGFNCGISEAQFLEQVNRIGIAIASQTHDVDPADKKLYALRDVTGTVDSRPLIVSSIMSKKLAAGADVIVLDVKMGDGAFMKTLEDAQQLAADMVDVGCRAGRKTVAVITDMDEPLGCAIGNALEVKEAISVLRGENAGHLRELCLVLGSNILLAAGKAQNQQEATAMLERSLENGSALEKLADMVEAQGGNREAIYHSELLPQAPIKVSVPSPMTGYVSGIRAENVGLVCLHLGGGRATKESTIDPAVGILLHKKVGDAIVEGEILAEIHAADPHKAAKAVKMLQDCYTFSKNQPKQTGFIRKIVQFEDVQDIQKNAFDFSTLQ
ncbi:MAG: pyrimidine-nucleoside phosphorylase [Oscillospiraceae bacterium]|jgi:pyrimidine-nucleoside phosphorylase